MQQSENIGTATSPNNVTELTPIPLFDTGSLSSALGYTAGVNVPDVVTWNGSTAMDVTTQANGQVSLTLAAGGNSYYSSQSDVTQTAPLAPASYSETLATPSNFALGLYNSILPVPTTDTTEASATVAPSATTVSATNSSFSMTPTANVLMTTPITVTGTIENVYGSDLAGQTVTVAG